VTDRPTRYEIATMPKDRQVDRHRARLHVNLVRTCAECGELILRSGPGRPPSYCSDRCRAALTQPAANTMQNGGEPTQHTSALTAT